MQETRISGVLGAGRDWLDHVARNSPARLALLVFASIIAVVTTLLSLPAATADGVRAPFADALFTATSAVCVTGLVTVDTATYWSAFGHAVILVGIKIGGLGVMTLASILGLAVSRRIGLTQRMLAASETRTRLGEVGSLVRAVIAASLAIEGALTLVLVPRFLTLGESFGQALWHGLFMALSIFNNAGFVIIEGGLGPFVGDWWLGLPIVVGTAIGAIGFPVILDVARSFRERRRRPPWARWNLHTKLTLSTYGLLMAGSILAIGAFEWTNPDTFGRLPFDEKVLASLVQGTNVRSSGLATVDPAELREATWFLSDALMFVGGGSASTAGGIKVTTFAVLVLAIVAEARGDRDVEAFGRRIGSTTVRLAVSVAFLGSTLVGVATLALLTLTDLHLDVILYEVISAFATVGLSTGITPDLPDAGKYVLSALMFAGRTGTMTMAAALALRERRRVIRMPNERPVIG
ncbi:Trk-type K+ transport system membrane component [Georgenia soli]|uniref:Trk-type K+ transport system membrane component n=1 Tax=Georgenia soli TaxID=638953 RepID=A0A2A9EP24_9MICO|nr:potassium transporter TrkG [Georgenia soli]PFG40336.1 Trk-type K+ transport system membrane component [Georgenia soli]